MIFRKWFTKEQPAAPAEKAAPKRSISATALAMASARPEAERYEFKAYEPAPGVVPAGHLPSIMAMDATPYGYLNDMGSLGGFSGFPGYPFLAELAQLPEYRKMVSRLAEEMVRKWIKLSSKGEGDKTDRIAKIQTALNDLHVRELFQAVTEDDGYFGRGQIYIEVRTPGGSLATDDPLELKTPLFRSNKKITKGSLVALRKVEPMWTYPGLYNSTNPLKKDYYKPSQWFVMGQTVHASRLLMVISRPVPDMLKAAYSFGGLSLSQLAKPYIDHWIRTRDSVSDIVHSFSVSGIATNMQATLAGEEGTELVKRAQLFNSVRDNRGLMLLDKDSEEFFQFNTPIAGLDKLQAQAQEQMASVSSEPLVVLLGITPTGLNASSDGEIRVWYDYVHSQQEKQWREPLKVVIDLIQLSEFGDIDDDIHFEFEPLYQLSDVEKAAVRKSDAETDVALVNGNIIDGHEARTRLASSPDSGYQSLDLIDAPDDRDEDRDNPDDSSDRGGASP